MTSLYDILKANRLGMDSDPWVAILGEAWKASEEEYKEYTGLVPYTFIANGQPLIDWYIKGNMQQTGTPTPQNPIQPSETGERTGNLFDDHNIITIAGLGDRYGVVLPPGTYSIYNGTDNIVYDGINDFANRHVACEAHSTATITLYTDPGTTCGFLMSLNAASQGGVTIVSGSTPPSSYIPYGYKLGIKSGNITTPVYLGQGESTRRIRKSVLTGQEDWAKHSTINTVYRLVVNDYLKITGVTSYNSHYAPQENVGNPSSLNDLSACFYSYLANPSFLYYIKDSRFDDDINGFKAYLQQQYSAGTPVTVWYVLATEETGIVNEPLRKIGTYADMLTATQAGIEIPTNNGSTTLDIDTTLKPSEVYIKYKGR